MGDNQFFQDPAFARYFFHSLDLMPIPTLVSSPVYAPDSGMEVNRQHLHVNRAFVQQLGYRLADIPDMHSWFAKAYPDAALRADVLQRWLTAVAQALADGQEQVQQPGLVTCADGSKRWFEVQAQIRSNNAQFPDWHIVTFKDIHHLRVSLDQVQLLSDKDPLTQLLNRRGLQRWQSCQSGAAGLVLLDIDHFKQINDRFGHNAGDHLLVIVAQMLLRHCSVQDACVRWGGEEFLVVLPGVDLAGTLLFAEAVRQQLASERLNWQGIRLQATLSAGCTLWPAGAPELVVLQQADQALYQAKQQGRNQVVAAVLP